MFKSILALFFSVLNNIRIKATNPKTIANVNTNRKFAAFTLDDFPLNRNYVIENDNEVIRRHEKINALTGYPSNTVRSIVGVTYEKSALELYFYTLDLAKLNGLKFM